MVSSSFRTNPDAALTILTVISDPRPYLRLSLFLPAKPVRFATCLIIHSSFHHLNHPCIISIPITPHQRMNEVKDNRDDGMLEKNPLVDCDMRYEVLVQQHFSSYRTQCNTTTREQSGHVMKPLHPAHRLVLSCQVQGASSAARSRRLNINKNENKNKKANKDDIERTEKELGKGRRRKHTRLDPPRLVLALPFPPERDGRTGRRVPVVGHIDVERRSGDEESIRRAQHKHQHQHQHRHQHAGRNAGR